MKFTGTVVCAGLSGSAADVTASRWKGVGYFRTRVIPANPQSAAQVLHRGHFSDVVAWWHDQEQQVKDECGRLMFGQAMSGFNGFTKRNVTDLAGFDKTPPVEIWPRIMPLNAQVNPIADDLSQDAGGTSKQVVLLWGQGEAVATDKMYFLAGEAADQNAIPTNLFLVEKETTATNAETVTLTMPKAAQGYRIFALVEHTENSTFSVARSCFAQSIA